MCKVDMNMNATAASEHASNTSSFLPLTQQNSAPLNTLKGDKMRHTSSKFSFSNLSTNISTNVRRRGPSL